MVSLALCMGTIGTALASPLYPIYQQLWGLLPSHITYIFVAYMFGCLATLLFLGRTSNSFGFFKNPANRYGVHHLRFKFVGVCQ